MARRAAHNHGWHAEDIKAAIAKRGKTLTALALENGLCESAVRKALRQRHSPSGERVVAEFLGVQPRILWPDRYDAHGNRLTRSRNHTRRPMTGQREKRAA